MSHGPRPGEHREIGPNQPVEQGVGRLVILKKAVVVARYVGPRGWFTTELDPNIHSARGTQKRIERDCK